MAWQQLSLTCRSTELAAVEELLMELGATSISLGDAGDQPIYEPLPGDSPVWNDSVVTATFTEDTDAEQLELALMARLPGSIAATLSRNRLEERDWELAYREHFRPLQCAPGLWIVPSWIDPPEPDAANVRLDPGLAFGTGGHPTTALCLAWLGGQDLAGLDLVDYGCGSGILAIAAIKLGAHQVLAVDIDPQAVGATRANMVLNAIDDRQISACLVDDAGADSTDLLMANILAGPLVELAPRFAGLVKPGGKLLLSGILITQLNEIQSAYAEYFELEAASRREDWICIGGRRKRDD